MTLDSLDTYIKNYINYLKQTKSLKGAGKITFKISRSKISKSIYVKLYVHVAEQLFAKTLRFSDHACMSHKATRKNYKGVVIDTDREISKREKKHIESVLRKEITRLIYSANLNVIYAFRADA